MSVICPSCNKLVDVVKTEKFENVTVNTYSCGHMNAQVDLIEKASQSLGIKVKDEKGKLLVTSKIKEQIEKRFSKKPSKAVQLVFKEGKFVQIHCKSADCGNMW